MGSRVQSIVGCFPILCILQLSVSQVHVGLRKQLIINFVYPACACAACFNNNNNNNNIFQTLFCSFERYFQISLLLLFLHFFIVFPYFIAEACALQRQTNVLRNAVVVVIYIY